MLRKISLVVVSIALVGACDVLNELSEETSIAGPTGVEALYGKVFTGCLSEGERTEAGETNDYRHRGPVELQPPSDGSGADLQIHFEWKDGYWKRFDVDVSGTSWNMDYSETNNGFITEYSGSGTVSESDARGSYTEHATPTGSGHQIHYDGSFDC